MKRKDETKNQAEKDQKSDRMELATIILGSVLITVLLLFVFILFSNRSMQDKEWARSVHLLAVLEALAFAAGGYFFGKEVNRKRAENAEVNAKEALTKAKSKEEETRDIKEKANKIALKVKSGLSTFPSVPGMAGNRIFGHTQYQNFANEIDELINLTKSDG